jgi:hypothetical protein
MILQSDEEALKGLKIDERLRARGMGSMEGKVWDEEAAYPENAEPAEE